MGVDTYHRGLEVLKLGRVICATLRPQSDRAWLIRSEVKGSQDDVYGQTTVITFGAGAGHSIQQMMTSCSCPVGSKCKHIVAALLSVAENSDPRTLQRQFPTPPDPEAAARKAQLLSEQKVNSWLRELDGIPKEAPPDRQDHVLYFLDMTVDPKNKRLLSRLTLTAHTGRKKVNGRDWTKPKPLGYSID